MCQILLQEIISNRHKMLDQLSTILDVCLLSLATLKDIN